MRLQIRVRNVTCVQCYAPTETSDYEEKEDFYSHLSRVVASINKGDIMLLMGDLNVQVGTDNTNLERTMGTPMELDR